MYKYYESPIRNVQNVFSVPMKIHFAWGSCTGAQGAHRPNTAVPGPGSRASSPATRTWPCSSTPPGPRPSPSRCERRARAPPVAVDHWQPRSAAARRTDPLPLIHSHWSTATGPQPLARGCDRHWLVAVIATGARWPNDRTIECARGAALLPTIAGAAQSRLAMIAGLQPWY
jgi:hypothetical protein